VTFIGPLAYGYDPQDAPDPDEDAPDDERMADDLYRD
jgi:hypothetical protein